MPRSFIIRMIQRFYRILQMLLLIAIDFSVKKNSFTNIFFASETTKQERKKWKCSFECVKHNFQFSCFNKFNENSQLFGTFFSHFCRISCSEYNFSSTNLTQYQLKCKSKCKCFWKKLFKLLKQDWNEIF